MSKLEPTTYKPQEDSPTQNPNLETDQNLSLPSINYP